THDRHFLRLDNDLTDHRAQVVTTQRDIAMQQFFADGLTDELYDIEAEPGQATDLAAQHPDIVEHLTNQPAGWFGNVEPDRADGIASNQDPDSSR
ncbi:MAG: hypothetical protein GYB21_21410, partial [Oceanospirillales bacterium]|nr:hypothetical protein [Oceanospirillales bacterium]